MLTLQQAAIKAGVSEKTIRRAIDSGKLVAHQRDTGKKQNNQPIYVDEQDLERYIASRQVQAQPTSVNTSGLASRIAELEQTIKQMQEDYRNDQLLGGGRDLLALGPMDDVHYSNQFDTLEKRVAGIEATVQRLQEQAEIDHKLAYGRIDVLERRIADQDQLIARLQELAEIDTKTDQEIDALFSRPGMQVLLEKEKAKLAATQDTFELADFTLPMQNEYRSSATRGDVKAWLTLRPEPQGIEGDYRIDYHACGRADGKRGAMGKEQQARGEQLKADLGARVAEALLDAGWQNGPHDILVCPGASST